MRSSRSRAICGMTSANRPNPRLWQQSAPLRLPRPMTSILTSPLSCGPVKAVCGLTRLMTNTPSAEVACASIWTGSPLSSVPITIVSIPARIGHPADAAVTPRCSSTRSCPSAVAPPWLPMHGTRKGRAPRSLNQSTVARTICGKPAIPREPTPMATSPLGRRRSATPDAFRASRTERGISESPSSGNVAGNPMQKRQFDPCEQRSQ